MDDRRPSLLALAVVWLVVCMLCTVACGAPAEDLGPWHPLWTREADKGRAVRDDATVGGGQAVIRIDHTGRQDWSLTHRDRIPVTPGDIFVITGAVRLSGTGSATLCATLYDEAGKPLEWVYGGRTVHVSGDFWELISRFAVPHGAAVLVPRLIGTGPATVWFAGFAIRKEGTVAAMQGTKLPGQLTIENKALSVTFRPADGTFAVLDRRSGTTWRQNALRPGLVVTQAHAQAGVRIGFDWIDAPSGLAGAAAVALDGDGPEVVLTLSAEGPLESPLAFPHPFLADPPAYLVVPMNEGISYPVDDASVSPMRLVAYGGHGICMPFWGVTDGTAGHMAILETPDDAHIRIERSADRLVVAPAWEPQKGRFGYARRLRYVFFDSGGHVAMCKRYRRYAKQTGLLKTLAEKRQAVPATDLLVGAVNVWNWDCNGDAAVAMVKAMQAAGIQRILWSHRQPAETLRALNALPGVLTSRYDIVQDVMDPAAFPRLRGVHPDWPAEAWPKDLMIGADGQWVRGWQVRAKDGTMIPCGTLCDRQAPPYLDRRMADELKTHPYRCRFIDTTTASPWRECYHGDHPMTRTESRRFKMDLLDRVSGKFKLVCGSETGHDAAVPYVHYFEGMLSLGPYRVPDSGRDMARIWTDVPEQVATFQLGHRYRLPLWELVYHDCVVAQWYWGDYNNKLPALWDKRDLFNVLYGTPPMFMFNRALWEEQKDRFARSYATVSPVARAVGYAEMTDHRFLTPDRDVQQTVFAGGVTVTVNFGQKPYRLPDGTQVGPMTHYVSGLKQ